MLEIYEAIEEKWLTDDVLIQWRMDGDGVSSEQHLEASGYTCASSSCSARDRLDAANVLSSILTTCLLCVQYSVA